MRFETYRARKGLFGRTQWRWRLKASNGRVIATSSESYNNLADMLHAIDLVRTQAGLAQVVEAV